MTTAASQPIPIPPISLFQDEGQIYPSWIFCIPIHIFWGCNLPPPYLYPFFMALLLALLYRLKLKHTRTETLRLGLTGLTQSLSRFRRRGPIVGTIFLLPRLTPPIFHCLIQNLCTSVVCIVFISVLMPILPPPPRHPSPPLRILPQPS